MPRFTDLPDDFCCPYRHGCPYLEGLPAAWLWQRHQQVAGTECHYEYQLEELHQKLQQEVRHSQSLERENQQLRAQLLALHRRQFKRRAADPKARQFCQEIQGWVHDACQAHHQLKTRPWRAQSAKVQERRLQKQLQELCRHPLRYPRAETLRERLNGPEQRLLLTCFRHPGVPPTNNQAERSLRPVVIMRKVIQGTRSEKGLENHTVIRSLFETAKRQGKKPHSFFLGLFTNDTADAQAALYRNPVVTSNPRAILRC